MNPLVRHLRRIGVASTSGSPGSARGYGANLAIPTRWSGVKPFSNLMRTSSEWQLDSGVEVRDPVTGWIKDIPAGASATVFVQWATAKYATYNVAGTYVATTATSGAYCTVTIGGAGTVVVGQGSLGSPTATFTLPDRGEYADYSDINIRVTIHNGSGSTIASITDVYCGLLSSKAAHDAGDPFDPGFIADLTGINVLRFMQWSYTASRIANFTYSDNATEANMLWFNDNWFGNGAGKKEFMPISVTAKLCKKLGCAMWLNLDSGCEKFMYTADAATNTFTTHYDPNVHAGASRPHLLSENEQIAFYGYPDGSTPSPPTGLSMRTIYYAHVVNSTQFQVRAVSGGSVVDITTSVLSSNDPYAFSMNRLADPQTYYQQIIAEIFAIYPGGTIIAEVSNEAWNGAIYERAYFEYVASLQAQTSLLEASNGWACGRGYAWYTLQAWKAVEAYYPRNQHVRTICGQGAYFGNIGSGSFAYVDPGIIQAGATTASLADMYCPALYYSFSIPQSAWDVAGGDVMAAYRAAGVKDWTDAQFVAAYKAGIDWAFDHTPAGEDGGGWKQTAFNPARAFKPTIKIGAYEGGAAAGNDLFNHPTNTDNTLIGERIFLFLRSDSMGLVADYFKDKMLFHGVNEFTQFEAAGTWFADDGGVEIYGMKRQHQVSDTPYATSMKSFGGAA